MLDELRHAVFVEVPLLNELELRHRFRVFLTTCEFTASTEVDASEIHRAVREVGVYADHLRACLVVHIDATPIPAAPVLAITARAAAKTQVIIASVTKPGEVVTREDVA